MLSGMKKKRKKRPFDKRCFATSALVCFVGLSAFSLFAKEKKIQRIVAGTVLDAADNGVADATVMLTDLSTGKKTVVSSKEGGLYQFTDLLPSHDYEVQATYKGSSSETRQASSVDPRNRLILNLKIPPAKAQ
jgi:hypothetical protein